MRIPLCLCLTLWSILLTAQSDLRIGEWRSYLPYRLGLSVTQSPSAVYYGSQWALLKVNKEDLSLEFFSKVEGLSDIGVQLVEYSSDSEALIVVYQNSNIDLIFEDAIVNLPQIRANTQIVKDRTIHDIYVSSSYAYLATGFGLVQLDIDQLEFGFTTFTDFPVRSVSRHNGQLYMSSEQGLFRARDDGSLNLADFSQWKKVYDEAGPAVLKEGGVLADSVHRDLDDPNMVTVYHQFGDASTAKAFAARLDSDEFRAMAQETGVHLETVEVWLLEDVE